MERTTAAPGIDVVYCANAAVDPGLYKHLRTGAVIEVCPARPRRARRPAQRTTTHFAARLERRLTTMLAPIEAAADILVRTMIRPPEL